MSLKKKCRKWNKKLKSPCCQSQKMMDGYKMKFFLLQLSFIGWFLLCCITMGIGFLWLQPYIITTEAKFYEELKARQK